MTARRGGDKIVAEYLLVEEILFSEALRLPVLAAGQTDKKLKNKENSTWPKANHYKTPS